MEQSLRDRIYSSTSLVADLDSTLVDGRVANGMGKYFLLDELKKLHINHVWLGLTNYRRVKRVGEERGEAEGLEYFFNIVSMTGCAESGLFRSYADMYVEKHSLPGAKELMEHFGEKMPTFISTIGSSIAAEAAADYYSCNSATGNTMAYPRYGLIGGMNITIRDGKDKLEATKDMLRIYNLTISDGIVLGNDRYDHELMRVARIPMASPLADAETKELVRGLDGIAIPDYNSFLSELSKA